MHVTTTGRVVFTSKSGDLEFAAEYLEQDPRGEVFFDDDGTLILMLEDDADLDGKDRIVEFLAQIYNDLDQEIDLHMIGVMTAVDSDCSQSFEAQCNRNHLRYREADVDYAMDINEGLSYEEFEEENNLDIDQDEYDEYVHRAHEKMRDDDREMYGDWEYFNLD